MFGLGRRKAVGYAVDQLRPIVGTIQQNYGIPVGFWQDEFVLGFLGLMIGFHMKIASGGVLSQSDKGKGLAAVFTALSNINGQELARQFTSLAMNETANFTKGGDNAAVICFYVMKRLKNEDENEDVKEAKQIACKLGVGGDRSAIAGALMQNLFMNEIVARFDLN